MRKLLLVIITLHTVGLVGCASTPNRTRTVYQYPSTSGYPSQTVYVPQTAPPSSQDETNRKILKSGILGAATGAIAAEASGGKAGTGALIGAGTNVIGGALFDVLTTPQAQPQQAQYAPYVNQWNQQNPNTNRIVRKYDSNGNVVSEEVFTRN